MYLVSCTARIKGIRMYREHIVNISEAYRSDISMYPGGRVENLDMWIRQDTPFVAVIFFRGYGGVARGIHADTAHNGTNLGPTHRVSLCIIVVSHESQGFLKYHAKNVEDHHRRITTPPG